MRAARRRRRSPLTAHRVPLAIPIHLQAAITLVSRRWHRMFYSEPALWRSLELTADSLDKAYADGQAQQWFAARASLLRRVGGFVQHLLYSEALEDFYTQALDEEDTDEDQDHGLPNMQQLAADSGGEWQLGSSVLAHLSPASLQCLHLDWVAVDAAAAAALARFRSLTQLQINCSDEMPSCLLAALLSLPRLLRLELRCDVGLPTGLPTALQQLTQLTSLACSSYATLPQLSALLPLTQLRQLDWQDRGRASLLQVDLQPLLARLPYLESWDILGILRGQEGMQVRSPIPIQVVSVACVHVCSALSGACRCTVWVGLVMMPMHGQLRLCPSAMAVYCILLFLNPPCLRLAELCC